MLEGFPVPRPPNEGAVRAWPAVRRPRFAATARLRLTLVLFASLGLSSCQVAAGDDGPGYALRIVSWDLTGAPNIRTKKELDSARPAWRTTFGSERHTREKERRMAGPLAIDADVVLLQGLTSMRIVRRMFPAREWRLIVSRQILERDDPLDPWSQDAISNVPTTAVAVRFQTSVRVSAQDHLLELAAPEAASGTAGGEKPAAATAVRITTAGHSLWVVSVALTQACLAAGVTCAAQEHLESWRRTHRIAGDLTLVGGLMRAAFAGMLPPPPCDGQVIEADPMPPRSEPASGEPVLDPTAGCLMRLDIGH